MRKFGFIWRALLPGLLLFPAGCDRIPDAEEDNGAISFVAGVSLIKDEATKATEDWNFINRTAFAAGESFRAFGRRTGEGTNVRILGDDGVVVSSSGAPLVWSYAPSSYWYWVSLSNYYDFLAAFYPNPATPSTANDAHRMESSPGVDIPGAMAIQKSYSLSDSYDLLMAGTRRSGSDVAHRSNKVPLTFQHMLCAVKVRVTNESTNKTVTVNNIRFDNLIQSASAKATIDVLGFPEFSWINTQRTNAEKSVYTNTSDPALTTNGGTFLLPAYTLFIPADLSVAIDGSLEPKRSNYDTQSAYETALTAFENKLTHLIINYTPQGGTAKDARIVLKNIKKASYGEAEAISDWEMGLKYTYNITIRMDGGVKVSVITTEWDEIEAETPGLLI